MSPFQTEGCISHSCKVLEHKHYISLLKINTAEHGIGTVCRSHDGYTINIMLHHYGKKRQKPSFNHDLNLFTVFRSHQTQHHPCVFSYQKGFILVLKIYLFVGSLNDSLFIKE